MSTSKGQDLTELDILQQENQALHAEIGRLLKARALLSETVKRFEGSWSKNADEGWMERAKSVLDEIGLADLMQAPKPGPSLDRDKEDRSFDLVERLATQLQGILHERVELQKEVSRSHKALREAMAVISSAVEAAANDPAIKESEGGNKDEG